MSSVINNCNDNFPNLSLQCDTIDKIENRLQKIYSQINSSSITRCPACRRKAVSFYCGECITNKNVIHSKQNILLSDKYKNYLRAQEKINKLESSNSYFNEKTKEQRLTDEINKIKVSIAEAKEKLKKSNARKSKLNETLEIENEAITTQRKKLLLFDYRYQQFMNVLESMQESTARKKVAMDSREKLLQLQVKYQISQVLDIIPVTLFSPDNIQSHNKVNIKRLLTYIEEGANTSYMRGEWEFTHQHEFESAMGQVFTQFLPADGNYYDFHLSNRDKGGKEDVKNNCFNISVGLSYLVQFVNLVSYYADVILPRPMEIYDFSNFEGVDYESRKFHKLIYNLNANIFHLCLSQGVPAKYLHPDRAIPNVIALMYHPSVQLGRFNPIIDVDSSANEYLEEVEVPDFNDSDDEQNDDKIEADGWEKLTPNN